MKRLFRTRAPALVAGFALALGFALAPSAARADIVFELGNHPPLGEEVQFPTTDVPGTTVGGETNQSHTLANFTSTEVIVAPSGGAARIEAKDGSLNDISIALVPGKAFEHLIFDPFNGSGTVTVTVTQDNAQQVSFGYPLGNGQNFLTISAVNGQRIVSVSISAQVGFRDLREVHVGGIGIAAVPEPASMSLLEGDRSPQPARRPALTICRRTGRGRMLRQVVQFNIPATYQALDNLPNNRYQRLRAGAGG
jgi:hypothetical protein